MQRVIQIGLGVGLWLGLSAQAQVPSALNLSGALYTASGATVANVNVSFKIEIWDANLTCVLYSEQHLGQDLNVSRGAFSFAIGSGTSQANNLEGGTAFDAKLFQNYGATGTFNGCVGGVTTAARDNRLIRVYYDTAGGTNFTPMSPDVTVTSAPYAMIAETLQGKTPANFILTNVNSFLGQSSVENIFSNVNYPILTSLLAGNSNLYMSSSPTGPVSFHNQLLTNIANPTAAQDAATKSYVDDSLGGQTFDPSGVGLGVGNGKTIMWDAGQNKWVTTSVGSVTSVGTGTGLVGGPITSTGTISVDVGTTANKILQLNATAQLPAVDGSLLSNINATRLGGVLISSTAPTSGQILGYNTSSGKWEPETNNAITALTGDVSAAGPGSVASTIQPNAVTSAKINNSGVAVNRLLITNATDGSTVNYATCTTVGEVMQWTALGWACADISTVLGNSGAVADTYGNGTQVPQVTVDATGRVQSLTNVNIAFPVVSVAGHTGAVTLNASDISGLGTAALKDVGVAANNVVQLNGSAKIPALDGSLLTNVNAMSLQSRSVSAAVPGANNVLTWNNSASQWEPQSISASGGLTSLSGDVVATGPGAASSTIQPNAITSAKINNSGVAVNRLLITNATDGSTVSYATCVSNGQVLEWSATGWVCTTPTTGSVTSVSAGSGLLGGVINSVGTISVDVGTTANKIVQLNGSGLLPAVDGSLLTNLNVTSFLGKPVSSVAPTPGQVLTYNNSTSQWDAEPAQNSTSGWANGGNTFGANSSIGNTDSYSLSFLTNNSARMMIDNAGRVGIGTTSAGAALEVDSSLTSSAGTDYGVKIQPTVNASGTEAYTALLVNATESALGSGTKLLLDMQVGGSSKFTVTDNGNVNMTGNSGGGAATLALTNTGPGFSSSGVTMYGSASVQKGWVTSAWLTNGTDSDLTFGTRGSSVTAERVRIDNKGNVGIGTTSPQAALDVYSIGSYSAIVLPRDTTANRPQANTVNGMLRYNTDLGALEGYLGGSWQSLSTSGGANSFSTDASFTGSGTGLAVTNTETVGGNLTVSGAAVLNGGATIAGGALNMSTQNITNVGSAILGAGALSIAAGGTNQNLMLSGSGTGNVVLNPKVGIGTTSPAGILDVEGSGTVIFNTGFMGLGTSSPSNILSFDGSAARTIAMERQSPAAAAAGNNLILKSGGASSGGTNLGAGNLILSTGTSTGTGTGQIQFQIAPGTGSGSSDSAPATAVMIQNVYAGGIGNETAVGIGTTTPTYSLDIAGMTNGSAGWGKVRVNNTYGGSSSTGGFVAQAGNANSIQVGQASSTWAGGGAAWTSIPANGSYVAGTASLTLLAASGTAYMNFATGGAGTAQERMRIDKNGLVGIGTSTPIGILDVEGSSTVILNAGNVGIGTSSPDSALHVVANIHSTGQVTSGSQTITSGTTAIDWNNGNAISTDYNCASNITFANMRDGGTYTLVIRDPGTTQCSFSTTTTGLDAATVAYKFNPVNSARVASTYTVYKFMRVGTTVLVSWSSGFQ